MLADVNGVLGMSPYGHSLKNISEQAISHGKSAGVVSSVPFSHATPAAFAAHNKNRNNYTEIAAEMVGSDLSVIMGAGVAAAILGAIATYLQSIGIVKVDFSALQKMFR